MRLKPEIALFLKQIIGERIPGSKVYLFGSRADDTAKGGDIDLLIISNQPVDKHILRRIRIEFYKKFGWRKLDLVNFTNDNGSAFYNLIKSEAVPL
jgi:predicted nucleotidyltransferase